MPRLSRGWGAQLVVLALALMVLAGGCSASQAQTSAPDATPSSRMPTALPFAPPVAPRPGQAFVGYWGSPQYSLSGDSLYFEVLPRGDGYEVSVNGDRPFPVPHKNGRLVLQNLKEVPASGGAVVQFGYELAWEDGRCVLLSKPSADIPVQRQPLARLTRPAYLQGVRKAADRTTRLSLGDLAIGVLYWSHKHKQKPPAPSQLRAGSVFERWLVKISVPAVWSWPVNPFDGEPTHSGTDPGDFSYVVDGREWTMTGHLFGGRTFDAKHP